MLVPSIFANSVFDDFFDFPYVNDKKTERKLYGHNAANLMKTDIQEYDDAREVSMLARISTKRISRHSSSMVC